MQKEKNKKIICGVVGVIVLIAAFYAGMVYGKGQMPARGQRSGIQTFNGGQNGGMGGRNFGGLSNGQVIAKDDKSITISVMGGGSKIILLDTNTKISKPVDAALSDLTIGSQVSVTGTPNSDGSVNAQAVQIRPSLPANVVK
jgi:hypothetical protein